MTLLITWHASDPTTVLQETSDPDEIAHVFSEINCRFERRPTHAEIPAEADQDTVLAAYRYMVEELIEAEEFATVDVVGIQPRNDPGWPEDARAMRQKFIDEHTHGNDDEVRFMIGGAGVFYLHIGDKVHAIYAAAGDLTGVPRGTTHWFDIGVVPNFKAIRFFHNPQGWIGVPTGSDISQRFPGFDEIRARAQAIGAA